jgi:hypothetical protein
MFSSCSGNPVAGVSVSNNEGYEWWVSLRHGGLLIAPSKLREYFPENPAALPDYVAERLRRDVTRLEAATGDVERSLLDTVLEKICGLAEDDNARWERGPEVKSEWSRRSLTGEIVKPRWLWHGPNNSHFPVFIESTDGRLGLGRGRRTVARVIEWLRASDQKVALLTNLRQWRLIFAGLDFDAWAEWDTALWFEEGQPGPQITALRTLLSRESLTLKKDGEPHTLLAAIQASRKGQAELSSELGERVRRAVELLIQEHSGALEETITKGHAKPRDVYLAATRVVMRMVVVLFAEARELLPRDNPIYHSSYGLQGLRELLERAGGGTMLERLRHRYGAWPRITALFRLVYEGSPHPSIPIPAYGGDLFVKGAADGKDPIARVLAVFENPQNSPSDAVVYQILTFLCRSRVKVRQGKSSTWVDAPVDFSDLSSEYIGILYEGLLNYELRRAGDKDPIVFLNLGDQPALPLSRLEAMDDNAVASLVEKAKKTTKLAASREDDAESEDDEDEDAEIAGEEIEEIEEEIVPPENTLVTDVTTAEADDDMRHVARERARTWARRAVVAGKLVAKPRKKNKEADADYEDKVEKIAESLIARTVLPGESFLVRFGGTFYTRPQLAVPTVQRTLRPLAYNPPIGSDGEPNEDAPANEWTPRKPEEILALKVCDPACGSGSFLVASLRFLTDALLQSLYHHGRINAQGENTLVTLAEGKPGTGRLSDELLPRAIDAPDFEDKLRARLKRYVVEHCIYGVDIDALAVELCRLSLWVETMDRLLPFSFLDHKIKCGNALVGCWFDYFRDYPALAWEREGGDKNHTRGVHFKKDAWTKGITEYRNKKVKPSLAAWIAGQRDLFASFDGRTPEEIHDEALALLETLHSLPIHETQERAQFYRDNIQGSKALADLKKAFDSWCALWFWPADKLELAPFPQDFGAPASEGLEIVDNLKDEYRFFHWELEFPDVFAKHQSGFDAMVGNPPWEIQKPNSKEFFSNIDPLYRGYGKQEALVKQTEYFNPSEDDEKRWLFYNAHFKALSNWNKYVGSPFGNDDERGTFNFGKGNAELHKIWCNHRSGRKCFVDPTHPFIWQGSADINTYKMFLEVAHALIRRQGKMGFLAPSGIYTDKGSTDLRRLFLTRCQWRWLFGFENREKVFDIDSRFKFCPIILEKGGNTAAIKTAFMHRDLKHWEEADRYAISYRREQLERFSPDILSFVEVQDTRTLPIFETAYSVGPRIGEQRQTGWQFEFGRELEMTSDSKLFPPKDSWGEKGLESDEYGVWRDKGKQVALPLYEGRMVDQFDFSAKGWVRGKGRAATWEEIPFIAKEIRAQFLMGKDDYDANSQIRKFFKMAIMRVSSATNARTTICATIPHFPAQHSLFTGVARHEGIADTLLLATILNSYVFDYIVRQKCAGNNLTASVLNECPLPARSSLSSDIVSSLLVLAACLSLSHKVFAPQWHAISQEQKRFRNRPWIGWFAVTAHERLRLRCMTDAIVAHLYNITWEELGWILRNCDYPADQLTDKNSSQKLDSKGFWRVDQYKEPELRHTLLSLAAFHDLQKLILQHNGDRSAGIRMFCTMNDGDGWYLPETFCLADLGLGHDERAEKPQPVREQLGPRFLPWQLEQSVEESWAECEMHACNILGEEGFARLQAELDGERTFDSSLGSSVAEAAEPYKKAGEQGKLF